MTPWLISKSSGFAATFRSRNEDNDIGSARKQNAMPSTPIGDGFEATAASAYCVVECYGCMGIRDFVTNGGDRQSRSAKSGRRLSTATDSHSRVPLVPG